MVMTAHHKSIRRDFRRNISRLISIIIIIFLGIAFVEGFDTISPTLENSYSEDLNNHNAYDFDLKATSMMGFSQDTFEKISSIEGVEEVMGLTQYDSLETKTRLVYMPADGLTINSLSLVEGKMPEASNEILAERSSEYIDDELGKIVNINGENYNIVGIVANSTIFSKIGEPIMASGVTEDNVSYLEHIYYLSQDGIPFAPITDIYVRIEGANINRFSNRYSELIEEYSEILSEKCQEALILSFLDSASFQFLNEYIKKVKVISIIFPAFFILVTALVVLTTMTRMIEEERSIIACQASLGFKNSQIKSKYYIFGSIAVITGTVAGLLCGIWILPSVLYPAFDITFFLPKMRLSSTMAFGIISGLFMLIDTLAVTAYVLNKDLRQEPAALMQPKAPVAGKKIFLEKIKFIWKRLAFRYKSSFRNIFRYRRHLIMTVVSVSGSTALVFAGNSLLAITKNKNTEYFDNIGNSLTPIAIVVMVFAVLLSVFVIYNLTNMNIQERKREIATLKVLGYNDFEVAKYIYREIMIMAIIGVIVGIPLGVGLMYFVFEYIEFGSLSSVVWYYYIFTILIIIVFVVIVDVLLYYKIAKVDMNSSLKSVD